MDLPKRKFNFSPFGEELRAEKNCSQSIFRRNHWDLMNVGSTQEFFEVKNLGELIGQYRTRMIHWKYHEDKFCWLAGICYVPLSWFKRQQWTRSFLPSWELQATWKSESATLQLPVCSSNQEVSWNEKGSEALQKAGDTGQVHFDQSRCPMSREDSWCTTCKLCYWIYA